MSVRRIIDAIQDGEKVYVKGHALATYMSDGSIVENVINQNSTDIESINASLSETIEDLNLKQDAISDLAEIRAGAEAGATALQSVPMAGSSIGGVKTGGDVTIASGVITVNDNSHNHIISNVDGLQTQLNAKAPLASPTLTGTPKAPTASAGTNSTQIATTAFVNTAITNKVINFENVTASSWVADSTYEDFEYRCDLTCSGVTASDFAEVVFSLADSVSGNYAPICDTKSGAVSIWSSSNDSITVPVIIVTKLS